MDILALDFDGVLCDSAGEAAAAGWKCAARLWPHRFNGDAPAEIVEKFQEVRPVMETGYESVLLVRLLRDGHPVDKILENSTALMSGLIREESLAVDDLVHVFGQCRDAWIAADFHHWIGMHAFYEGVVDAVNRSKVPTYIITTKEKRFAVSLCNAERLRIPEENIFGLESGKKQHVLVQLAGRHKEGRFYFLEDRLQTLIRTADAVDFDVRFYLADWGYNTAADRELAVKMSKIEVVTQDQFPHFVQKPSSFI